MDIFGLDPYVAAIVIAVIGVALTNTVGWLKNDKVFLPRKVAASALIAVPASVLFVATQLQAIGNVEAGLTTLIVVVGLIAQVAGFDTLVKNAKAIIKKRLNGRKNKRA